VVWVRGNADRELVEMARKTFEGDAPDAVSPWAAEELRADQVELLASLPTTVTIGDVLCCHATPRNDEEIFTELTPDEVVAEMFADAPGVTVVGHTHMQVDRRVDGKRIVNSGSVGIPYEGRRGAFWALLGPDVELVSTDYDVESAAAAIGDRAWSESEQVARWLLEPEDPDKVTEFFESARRA
jgi:predicted phosphodiesterase